MRPSLRVGRYDLYGVIAVGGMATVHYGRMLGEAGFRRTVAIKRLHPHLAREREVVDGLLDEAHLAARIRHLNVVAANDLVRIDEEVFLVMEYVPGESLARLLLRALEDAEPVPLSISISILCGALHGLHAAHEARRETGEPLQIVHRDVSPQNILVGTDGVARVLDFGVAKAVGRLHSTRGGAVKGKLAYMAPEQLRGERVDRRADVFAAGVVMWEAITGQKLFAADNEPLTMTNVLERPIRRPREIAADVPSEIDAIVMRALERDPAKRFSTARQMALALEAAHRPASPAEVEAWVFQLADDALAKRAREVAELESEPVDGGEPEPVRGAVDAALPVTAAPTALRSTGSGSRKGLALGLAAVVALLVVLAVKLGSIGSQAAEPTAGALATASAAVASSVVGTVTLPASTVSASVLADAVPSTAIKPPTATSKLPRVSAPRPPAPRGPRAPGVTEYVDSEGVTHFCRPPNCPK